MSRTVEQIAADNALALAIEGVRAVYQHTESDAMLTDFLVIYAEQGYTADGEGFTRHGMLCRDANMPIYRALGLLDYQASKLRAQR